MRTLALVSLSAAAGAAVCAAALPECRAATRVPPQAVSFRYGRSAYADNQIRLRPEVRPAMLTSDGTNFTLILDSSADRRTRAGTGTLSMLHVAVHRCADVRTLAAAATYTEGTPQTGGCEATFNSTVFRKVGRGAAATIVPTVGTWATSGADTETFWVQFTRWDPVRQRLQGRFGGGMQPSAESGFQNVLRAKSGKFLVAVSLDTLQPL